MEDVAIFIPVPDFLSMGKKLKPGRNIYRNISPVTENILIEWFRNAYDYGKFLEYNKKSREVICYAKGFPTLKLSSHEALVRVQLSDIAKNISEIQRRHLLVIRNSKKCSYSRFESNKIHFISLMSLARKGMLDISELRESILPKNVQISSFTYTLSSTGRMLTRIMLKYNTRRVLIEKF